MSATRLVDALLGSGTGYAGANPVLNLKYGGLYGELPNIGAIIDGKYYPEYINSTPYVRQPVIAILLSYPKMFNFLPNKQYWIGACKALFEVHPKKISGLKGQLSVEVDGNKVGRTDEVIEVPLRTKREQSKVNYEYTEVIGRPISLFYDFWIRYGLEDPDIGRPLIHKYFKDQVGYTDYGGAWTADYWTATCLYIEPDIMGRFPVKAWLCYNMFPTNGGPYDGDRDLQASKSLTDVSIEFSHATLCNEAVMELARNILPSLKTLREIPDVDLTLPEASIEPAVKESDHHGIAKTHGNTSNVKDPYPVG